MSEIKYRNIPTASVNATVSEKSFNTWLKRPAMIKEILSTFSVTLVQTEKKADLLKKLGSTNVKYVGNLKFTVSAPEVDAKKQKELRSAIGARAVICFSSTHKGEEEIAIRAHESIAKEDNKLLSIILPRHPNRKDEIKELLEATDLNFCFRSEGSLPTAETDIYVADTFGEIGTFYSVCPLVFMGGSLSPFHDGGHNPIEPSNFGCVVVSGNKISAFETIFESLKKSTKIVISEKELQKSLLNLMTYDKKMNAMSKEALKIAGKDNTIIKDIITELKKAKVV